MTADGKKVLFVLSGGGMPGLDIHVGIWRALSELGITATDVSGTSAGAIIGALNASGWLPHAVEDMIRSMSDDFLRQTRLAWPLRLASIESIMRNDHILGILEDFLPTRWSQFRKPFSAWACDKRTGALANTARPELTSNPALAVLASMSICGIFPAVPLLDGNAYIDGGARFNLPLPENWTDFEEVWLLVAATPPEDYTRNDVLSNLLRNIQVMHKGVVANIIDRVSADPRIRIIWPSLPGDTSLLSFNHDLIDQAYVATNMIVGGKMDCQAGRYERRCV